MSCFDTKQSDGEAPVMLELWGMKRTPSLPLLSARVVAPDKALSIDQIELGYLNGVLINDMLNWIVWNRTVWSFNCV